MAPQTVAPGCWAGKLHHRSCSVTSRRPGRLTACHGGSPGWCLSTPGAGQPARRRTGWRQAGWPGTMPPWPGGPVLQQRAWRGCQEATGCRRMAATRRGR